jgi:ribonuclease BN (tRNA processing enzyme)
MKVRILGCSGGIGAGLRSTSLLIDDDILIDAGTGLGDLTLEEMGRIRHIFVTHSHLDHVCFIPLLIDTIFDMVEEPVIIHGQESTLQALQGYIFNWVVWPDFAELPRPEAPVLRYRPMQPGDTWENNGRTFEMINVNHIVPAVGYRVADDDGSFAFSGDTTTNDSFWEALNAHPTLDMLIVEAAFADHNLELSKLAKHYCPSLLAEDMAKLRHNPEIYITHRKPGEEERILQECREHMPERKLQPLSDGEVFAL